MLFMWEIFMESFQSRINIKVYLSKNQGKIYSWWMLPAKRDLAFSSIGLSNFVTRASRTVSSKVNWGKLKYLYFPTEKQIASDYLVRSESAANVQLHDMIISTISINLILFWLIKSSCLDLVSLQICLSSFIFASQVRWTSYCWL